MSKYIYTLVKNAKLLGLHDLIMYMLAVSVSVKGLPSKKVFINKYL